jgi:Tol biopolymer transport system component
MQRSVVVTGLFLASLAFACGGDGVGPAEPSGAGRIAFQMRRNNFIWDIYTVARDGSDLRNLTQSPEDDVYPAWSHDSRWLAFVSARDAGGIYVINADGGARRLLYTGLSVEHLTWAPDGNRLAFAASGAGFEIYVINSNGSGLRRLTSPGSAPDWSPHGDRIAFHQGGDIMVIDADGTDLINLTPNTSSVELDPVWSPDGSRIAFATTLQSLSIYTMAADGSDWRRVTTPPPGSADRVPDWSPDGIELAFQRETFPTAQVYAIRLDGTRLRIVADTLSGHPAW